MTAAPKQPKELNDPARQAGDHPPRDEQQDEQGRKDEAEGRKATQFDGNPNVQKAPEGPFGPKDDTPWKLKKKE